MFTQVAMATPGVRVWSTNAQCSPGDCSHGDRKSAVEVDHVTRHCTAAAHASHHAQLNSFTSQGHGQGQGLCSQGQGRTLEAQTQKTSYHPTASPPGWQLNCSLQTCSCKFPIVGAQHSNLPLNPPKMGDF